MTPEEASIILCSCPPGDVTNPDIPGLEEARALAIEHKALAAWWNQERKFDQIFGRKLSSIMPPPELATTIMRGGATIFFASRLIAESADVETDEDPPEETDIIVEKETTLPASSTAEDETALSFERPPPPSPWPRRIAILCVLTAALLGLLIFSVLLSLRKTQ